MAYMHDLGRRFTNFFFRYASFVIFNNGITLAAAVSIGKNDLLVSIEFSDIKQKLLQITQGPKQMEMYFRSSCISWSTASKSDNSDIYSDMEHQSVG